MKFFIAHALLVALLAVPLWNMHQQLSSSIVPETALLAQDAPEASRIAIPPAPADQGPALFDVRLPPPPPPPEEPDPDENLLADQDDQPRHAYAIPRLLGVFTTDRTRFVLLEPEPNQRIKARPGDLVEGYQLEDIQPGAVDLRGEDGDQLNLRIFRRDTAEER